MLDQDDAAVNQAAEARELPLLATKFYIPPVRSRFVARERLLQRLESGVAQQRRFGLIVAPAGYGKTTLAAEWLATYTGAEHLHTRVAWLSLEEAENEPARFFAWVLATLRRMDRSIGSRTEQLLRDAAAFSAAACGAALIEDLAEAAGVDAPLLLLLDDYHRIENRELHAAVELLVEHAPASFHLILMTREDPPLPLARWRVQNRMMEVRARDLRFTLDETADFLRRVMALALPEALIEVLSTRTEGWVAGLQLAALSLFEHADPAQFVRKFAGDDRQVVDYLGDEVLARQPEALQRFLLATSVLDRLCGALCEAVASSDVFSSVFSSRAAVDNTAAVAPLSTGQQILERLERRNLFVVPLDHRRRWYRYHHLFADLLRHHLEISVDAAAVADLHRRAALWYAEAGYAADAVHHALCAADVDLAAALIESALASSATWSGGDVGAWRAWWRALPASVLHARPLLSLRLARALYLAGQIDEAEHLLDEAERLLRQKPEAYAAVDELLAQAAVHRAAVAALRGDSQPAIDAIERALAALPAAAHLIRARAHDTLGLAYELQGETTRAEHAYLEAATLAETAGVRYLVVNARAEAAMVQIAQGELARGAQTCQSLIDSLAPVDDDTPPLGLARAILGEIRREQNALQEAEALLLAGMAHSEAGGITDDLRHEHLFLARLRQSQGDYAGALAALRVLETLLQPYRIPRLFGLMAAQRARVWLAEGHLAPAAAWAAAYAGGEPADYLREVEDLTLARVWLATNQVNDAAALLAQTSMVAERGGRIGCVIECLTLRALALAQQGEEKAALSSLNRALARAEPEGYARVFLDEGRLMLDLLYRAAADEGSAPYAGRLLSIAGEAKRGASPLHATADATEPELIEPLTERELEVLALLASRFTNQEIARHLVVSLPTVKTHAAHIYAKLGVDGRREAVARARRLGLLSA
ncbi:MAG: AAA family ATPase [Anaerolineales bacterium]|nr:AAA family ATPase [Anaerolineales bacterium]